MSIATAHHAQDVVDKADRLTTDAATSIRRLDRTTRDLDPAVRSLRRASDALNNAARAAPQAPLIARRPQVASMRWLLPDPSSS